MSVIVNHIINNKLNKFQLDKILFKRKFHELG